MNSSLFQKHLTLKPLSICISIAVFSAYMTPVSHAAPAAIHYQIQKGSLTDALNYVAQKSNVTLLLDAKQTDAYRAPPLSGLYTPEQAFASLLQGTPFRINKTAAGYLLVNAQTGTVARQRPDGTALGNMQAMGTASTVSTAARADVTLSTIELTADQDRYQQGKDNQFQKDIVNIYKNKDEVEHFKGSNPADILSGIPGVYSSDARNSGSLSPNVRGLQGQGRVPVIVDGTQQEISVYRGYSGVNNRTYVDPNLLSETTVYKGATELGYAVPSAIGGAVMLNTINSDDVIPEGKNWGINLRYETNNNSTKANPPSFNYGQDYRTTENWWAILGDVNPQLYKELETSGKNRFFEDSAFRVAVAGKNDLTDIMLAYSKRNQGNYFSGKRGGEVYSERFDNAASSGVTLNVADIAPPGYEVSNTSSSNESVLIKNNWNLPNNQTLKLSWRHSDIEYGEIMNSRSVYGFVVDQLIDGGSTRAAQWPLAKVKQDAGRIDYAWQPDDSNWINLKLGTWYSRTDSRNNSSGASPYAPRMLDTQWATYIMQFSGCVTDTGINPNCQISQAVIDAATKISGNHSNSDGRFNLINPALQVSANDRWGVDISNTFALHPQLDLTVGGSLQKEKLNSSSEDTPLTCSDMNNLAYCKKMDYVFGPKSGERQEYNSWFNFDWRATNRLTINVGGRWGRYWSLDTQLDEKLQSKQWSRPKVLEAQIYKINKYFTKADEEAMKGTQYHYVVKVGDLIIDDYDYDGYAKSQGYAGAAYQQGQAYQYKNYEWRADENGVLHADNAPGTLDLKEGEKIDAILGDEGKRYRAMTEEEKYAPIGKRRGQQFDPSFSISYALSDFSRAYARYVEATRFPSIYESSIGFSENISQRGFEPEHAQNIEVGYVHDLGQWLLSWRSADVKLNYYHNKIKDVIDRNYNTGTFAQYDQLKTQGIELQTRFDQGRIFGDFGYSYLIKSEMCDADYAALLSPIRFEAPSCFIGGFPGGYLRGAIPPKHSISANLATRLWDDKLTVGTRVGYHSMSNIKKQSTEGWTFANQGLDSYGWKSYWTVDAYADLMLTPAFKVSVIGTNLRNEYYPDALTRTAIPAPGRTLKLAFDYKF
ncbi:TonB-dependent receptor [Acinetobacter larvae]|nr:TonB-dependent receptor [Acinetobacter larvae]